MLTVVRHFLLAVQFFTRIPITGALAQWVGYSPAMLSASSAYFPLVGWIVGGVAAGSFLALSAILPAQAASPFVAAVLSTAATVWLTGAFHEDGLADTCDGLGGSAEPLRALEIMKDSRIGTYGTVALVLALLLKTALLLVLAQSALATVAMALLVAHVVSRWFPLWIIYTLTHMGDTQLSKSKPLAENISGRALLIATIWCVAALALASLCLSIWALGIACALSAAVCWRWHALLLRRLGGYTGDTLGAVQQTTELAFYFGVAVSLV